MDPMIWYFITLFGEALLWFFTGIVIIIIYLLLRYKSSYKKTRRMKIFKNIILVTLLSLLISYLLVTAIKTASAIPRPCIPCNHTVDLMIGQNCNLFCPYDDSFPSGHATIAFVIATYLVLVTQKKKLISLYLLAALVGISRVMLGVHYWGDVIAGASLGMGITIVVWRAMKNKLKM